MATQQLPRRYPTIDLKVPPGGTQYNIGLAPWELVGYVEITVTPPASSTNFYYWLFQQGSNSNV